MDGLAVRTTWVADGTILSARCCVYSRVGQFSFQCLGRSAGGADRYEAVSWRGNDPPLGLGPANWSFSARDGRRVFGIGKDTARDRHRHARDRGCLAYLVPAGLAGVSTRLHRPTSL